MSRSTGKRLRFEILKRDGFRCRYCGANSIDVPLQVDHVIPIAEGGTDDPANLVTACQPCNGGKSDIGLEESLIQRGPNAEDLREQADQIRAYLDAVRELEASREAVDQYLLKRWCDVAGTSEMPRIVFTDFRIQVKRHGIDVVQHAVEATAQTNLYDVRALKYFRAVIRNAAGGE